VNWLQCNNATKFYFYINLTNIQQRHAKITRTKLSILPCGNNIEVLHFTCSQSALMRFRLVTGDVRQC